LFASLTRLRSPLSTRTLRFLLDDVSRQSNPVATSFALFDFRYGDLRRGLILPASMSKGIFNRDEPRFHNFQQRLAFALVDRHLAISLWAAFRISFLSSSTVGEPSFTGSLTCRQLSALALSHADSESGVLPLSWLVLIGHGV
jgi:hypothetical protein